VSEQDKSFFDRLLSGGGHSEEDKVREYISHGVWYTIHKRTHPNGCSRKVAGISRSEHKGAGRALLLTPAQRSASFKC